MIPKTPMLRNSILAIQLDRRRLEHPRAYHLRRMRAGIWLYLDLLARLPVGAETIEVEPAAIGEEMGLPEGTVRSWLGHLRKAGYVAAERLNGKVRVKAQSGATRRGHYTPSSTTWRHAQLRRLPRWEFLLSSRGTR
jgi:DNA-binding transcriptional regulator PaaX